jgi:hypothetical protein
MHCRGENKYDHGFSSSAQVRRVLTAAFGGKVDMPRSYLATAYIRQSEHRAVLFVSPLASNIQGG